MAQTAATLAENSYPELAEVYLQLAESWLRLGAEIERAK
jgi:hypothetical protein